MSLVFFWVQGKRLSPILEAEQQPPRMIPMDISKTGFKKKSRVYSSTKTLPEAKGVAVSVSFDVFRGVLYSERVSDFASVSSLSIVTIMNEQRCLWLHVGIGMN